MTKENLHEQSTEELIKKKKNLKFFMGVLIGMLITLLLVTVEQSINEGFTAMLIIPFASIPIIILVYGQVKSITKVLKSRGLN